MRNTKQTEADWNWRFRLVLLGNLLLITSISAKIEINLKWDARWVNGKRIPSGMHEIDKLEDSTTSAALKRNATPLGGRGVADPEIGGKMFLDGKKYYIAPVLFMGRSRPEEVCTPADYVNTPTYQCEEGQRYTHGAHIFIFDSTFQEVGYHLIRINQPWPFFCNSVPSVGTGDKKRNEMLVTVQYFPVDRKAANKVSNIGTGWARMTVLLRVQEKDGKMVLEQDDTCLGNPNQFESIPDARRRLKQCLSERP